MENKITREEIKLQVNELLENKLYDLILEMQNKLGIEYGDVYPDVAMEYDEAQEKMADVISLILEMQLSDDDEDE